MKRKNKRLAIGFIVLILFSSLMLTVVGEEDEYEIIFDEGEDCKCEGLKNLGIELINCDAGKYTTYTDGKADKYSGLRCVYAKQTYEPSGLDREVSVEMEIKCYKTAEEASDKFWEQASGYGKWNEKWDPTKPEKYEVSGIHGAVVRSEGSYTRLSFIQKIPFLKNADTGEVGVDYSGETFFRYSDKYIIDIHGWAETEILITALDTLEQYAKSLIDAKTVYKPPKNHAPTVKIIYSPKNPTIKDTITFSADASDEDGDELTYEWYEGVLESSTSPYSKNSTMELSNLTQANYYISVKVFDGKGGEAWDSVTVWVSYYEPEASDENVYLEVVYGKVTVNGQEVGKGTKLQLVDGDIIETSLLDSETYPGYASLRWAQDGGRSSIMPGTRLMYQNGRIFIWTGDYHRYMPEDWYKTVRRGYGLEVYTPQAISSVIGTEYEVVVEEDGTTIFHVFKGVVEVSDIDMIKTVSVNAGEITIVHPSDVPSEPVSFDIESYDKWWGSSPFSGGGLDIGKIVPIVIVIALILAAAIVAIPRMKKRKIVKAQKERIRCPNCGAVNYEDDLFCVNCGAKLQKEGFFCPNCGVENKEDDLFCVNCGAKFQ